MRITAAQRAANENRDDAQIMASQRQSNLYPDRVVNLTQPLLSRAITNAQPVRADQYENNRARTQGVLDRLGEVFTDADGSNVMKDMLVTKSLGQVGDEPPSPAGGVVTPIADKDPTHGQIVRLDCERISAVICAAAAWCRLLYPMGQAPLFRPTGVPGRGDGKRVKAASHRPASGGF